MSRYLVTGCAGFIGSHLTDRLLSVGHEVVGVDVFTPYYDRSLKDANLRHAYESDAFSLVEADLVELSLEPLLADVDGVFHLAAQAGVRASWGDSFVGYTNHNVIASQRLFEAVAKAGVRVVWASSSSVYGNAEAYPTREDAQPRPMSPYGVTKLACEHLADAYAASFGLDHVALRYFTVYGPRQRPDMAFTRIMRALMFGTTFNVFGTGKQSRDVTYVLDAVSATMSSMNGAPSGAVYNVGGGSETALNDVLSLCTEISGRDLDVRYEDVQEGDVKRTAADTSLIRRQVGWRPRVSLVTGLEEHFLWAEREMAAPRARGASQ